MNTRIFAIFATILMLGTLATPVSAGNTADEKKYEIDELLYDLEDAVASYNEAVAEGYILRTQRIMQRTSLKSLESCKHWVWR